MRMRYMLLIFICLTLQVGMEPEKWQQETLKDKFTCKVCILHQHPAKKWGYLVFPKKKTYIKDRIWKKQKLTGYISLSISEFCQGYYILQIYPANGYIPGYISLGIYIRPKSVFVTLRCIKKAYKKACHVQMKCNTIYLLFI